MAHTHANARATWSLLFGGGGEWDGRQKLRRLYSINGYTYSVYSIRSAGVGLSQFFEMFQKRVVEKVHENARVGIKKLQKA